MIANTIVKFTENAFSTSNSGFNSIIMQHYGFKAWLLPVLLENNELFRQGIEKLILRDLAKNRWFKVLKEGP